LNYLKNCPNCSTTLRFPASQGTVLVRCPVCSHRFQFNATLDTEFTSEEKEIPAFQFNPSKQEYLNLLTDLLYAPIDFFKTKFQIRKAIRNDSERSWKKPKLLIELLLFIILLLYLVRGFRTNNTPPPVSNETPSLDAQSEEQEPPTPPVQKDLNLPSIEI
jgi:hypothetical protein